MLNKIYAISIKTKITITIFLIIVFFSISLIWQVSISQKKDINTLAINTTKDIIKTSETFFIKSLLENDVGSIYKFLDSLTKINIIKSAGFIDTKNHIVAHTNSLLYPMGSVANFTKDDNIVKIKLLNEATHLGYFVIEIEKAPLMLFFDNIQTHFIIFIITAALFSFLIGYFISHRILYRLEIVSHNALMIQQKKWNQIKKIETKENDEITLFQNSIEDILKQLNSLIENEKELREFYHDVLDSIDGLVVICDEGLNIVYTNNHKLKNIVIKNQRNKNRLLQKIKEHKREAGFIMDFYDTHKNIIYLFILFKKLKDSFAISISDITELKKLQERQYFANSFEMVGEMSSGVVHEIKNYLQPIKLLLDQQSIDKQDKEKIAFITSKIDLLVKEFLATGRPIDKQLAIELDVEKSLNAIFEILNTKLSRKNIHLDKMIPKKLNLFMAPLDFETIIVNILDNAIDETEQDGIIEIKARSQEGYTVIEITDFGRGINKDLLKHIYKPFYTTKGVNGTGIGLYMVYKIVYLYGGYIEVNSKKGKTVFRLYIPAKEKK